MKKLGKLFLCALFAMCAVLLAAQETVSADDVDALALQMDELLKERNELKGKEASAYWTIEANVNSFEYSELEKRYAELEQYKDYFEEAEYQEAIEEAKLQVSAAAQKERARQEQNAKPELDKLAQEKKELTEKIEGLEKVLLGRKYKIHTTHVVETKYDTTTKSINIRFIVPEFEKNFDVNYAFDTTGLTTFEIAKKGAEEEGKDYSADVYYTVTKDDGTDCYIVNVTSLDLYYAGGEKIVSEIPLYSGEKRILASDFSFSVTNMKINIKDGFTYVDGGTFNMGKNNSWSSERPVHSVTLNSFYICDHEVTQAEYKAAMGTNPSYHSGDNRPVEKVSWYDAIEYCNKLSLSKGLVPCYSLNGTVYTSRWGAKGSTWNNVICDFTANGYRLPTEAEWEYAARGGIYSWGYKYSGSDVINEVANNYDSVQWVVGSTNSVRTKLPNELWLYDMSGNVSEWCWDWYGSYDSSAQTNPTGSSSGSSRVNRGGGWNDVDCEVTYRYCDSSGSTNNDLGFRVVRTDVKSLKPLEQSQNSSDNSASISSELKNDFILVEGGSFKMGSTTGDSDEKPVHSVSVSRFYMCEHEVTQAEYKAVMGNNPSETVGDNKPVENVSWNDAIEYCNKLSQMKGLTPCYVINGDNVSCNFAANGFRLPTEAEWEYAARGGNKSKDYTYSGSNSLGNIAWYTDNSKSQTHDVKMKTANELGLYDMSGNVWEWCWDFYGSYSSNAQINPTGILSGSSHVRRGGSWYSGDDFCSVSVRSGRAFNYKDGLTGFRVVRSITDGFIFVEGGTFDMGSTTGDSYEKPVYSVTVSSFFMSDHEVTQAEYKEVIGTNPSFYSGDNRPVEQVSWYDAVEYCNKLSEIKGLTPCYKIGYGNIYICDLTANGYRLPTEAEWEYAARGGNKGKGYEYSGSNDIENVAWYWDNSNEQTHAVKEKQPNELGIYDMSGNVWEWCWDWYGYYSSGAVTNPLGASSGSLRVFRGGSWINSVASYCCVAYRGFSTPGDTYGSLGFRVVRTAK